MISGYQIHSVIKAYLKNMKTRAAAGRKKTGVESELELAEDTVAISKESIRMFVMEQVDRHMASRITMTETLRVGSGASADE
jgi:hypothetical protein